MTLDINNNTAGKEETGNQGEQESPQSILEKRLAELSARKEKAPGDPLGTAEEKNAPQVAADAIAGHEVMPPLTGTATAGSAADPAWQEINADTAPPAPNLADPLPVGESDTRVEVDTLTQTAIPPEPELVNGHLNKVEWPADPAAAHTEPMGTANQVAPEPEARANQGPALVDLAQFAVPPGVPVSPVVQSQTEKETPANQSAEPTKENASPEPSGESPPSLPAPTDTGSAPVASADPEAGRSTAGIMDAPLTSGDLAIAGSPEAAVTPEATLTGSETPATQDLLEEEHHEELLPEADYSLLGLDDLRQKLLAAMKTGNRKNSRQIFEMHKQYESKMASEKAEALQRFVAEGNEAEGFNFSGGPAHQEVEQAYHQFRESRNRDQRQEEEQRIRNSRRKQELLEQLRLLVESPETKSSADKIKAIQNEWKAIGPVPTNESQQLWNSYHALLDIFYNNRSIFFELKELDRRRNLQYKLQLCERAEALVQVPSINTALTDLRNLHEEWKNVGPVPNEQRDAIWERFIQASEKVHERKKEFISERRAEETINLTQKLELLGRIAVFQQFQTDRINDWRDKTDEIQKVKEEWDAVGLVPKERADEVNKQFWSSYKAFFNHKNAFFKALDEQKMGNMRLKTELCEQAESLKDSEDWDDTKEKLIQLQKKWKTIGRVPDKYSDKLWNRFRAACNEFFDRKQNQVQAREAEVNKASAEKAALFEEMATRVTQLSTQPGTMEELESLHNRWESLAGSRGTGKLDDKFFELVQQYVGAMPALNEEEKSNLLIQLQVDHIKHAPDAGHRLHQKEQSIRKEIAHLETDIRTLKTNIEFFGRSKNADKWRGEYQARIEEADRKILLLQQQLYAIRNA